MGRPLPNLVQTGFLPHLDSMDLLSLLAHVFISQSKWGTRRGLRTRKVGQARLPIGSIPFHPSTDVLGHMLDDPKHEIEGMHLPKGGCIRD
jgi:hypothetical protein